VIRVAVGDTIADSVVANGVRTYSFVGESGAEYAAFFETSTGSAALVVADSTNNEQLGAVFDAAGGPGLSTVLTGNFSRAGVLLAKVTAAAGAFVHFRFLIFHVNRAPELRAARFIIGDTVSGEALNPIPDIDDFVAAGQAGQELVGWIEPLGPAPGVALSLLVSDSQSPTPLGGLYPFAGQSPLQVFTLPPLPGTRDYGFTVPAQRIPGYPAYTGPYRFQFYPIDRAPESISPALPLNTTVTGEAIDIAGDIDEFSFPATSGQEFNAFLKSSSPRILTLARVGDAEGGGSVSVGPDTGSIFQHSTGRFKVLTTGTYRLRVSGESVVDATGPFQLFLYPVNRAPELVPAAITPGDTIEGETIELPGDIDEFTFSGAAGDEFNVFLQAANPKFPAGVTLSVITPGNALLANAQTFFTSPSLLRTATGRFTLPVSGTYRVTVDGSVGPYRFFVYPVDRHPESAYEALAFGDSVITEAIDAPGDIDEFTVVVPESSLTNLVLELGPDSTVGYTSATLVRSGSGEQVAATFSYLRGGAAQTGRFALGPGSYMLRIDPGASSAAYGGYRLMLYRFQASPESVNETIVVGDTVEGESLNPPGDLDRFYFNGTRGEHINIAMQGTAAVTSGGFQALLVHSSGYPPIAIIGTPTSGGSLDDHQSLRIDLPVTGQYRIDVTSSSSPAQLFEHGGYRLAVTHVGTTPEVAPSALLPGDSVITESIDVPGDWDQFSVSATPGEDLGLVFQFPNATYPYPWVVALDPVTGDSLEGTYGLFERFAGPFRVPAGGHVAVAVFELPRFLRVCFDPTCNGVYGITGGYKVKVIRINRAPESVAAAYTVGDTVRGEAIAPVGDVDEFVATATPGAILTPLIRLTASPEPLGGGGGITLEVIDPATGDTLSGRGVSVISPQQQFVSLSSFTVPPSGSFIVRVRGSGFYGDELTTAPYEMSIKR